MVVLLVFCVVIVRLSVVNISFIVDDLDLVCFNQRDLLVFMEMIKFFFLQYDGVDLIKEIVKYVVDLVYIVSQNLFDDFVMLFMSWIQILIDNLELYLKMVMFIDFFINKG